MFGVILPLYTGLIPDVCKIIEAYNERLYIYHLERDHVSYEDYNDCIVISNSADNAKLIHPDGTRYSERDATGYDFWNRSWIEPHNVILTLLGEAIGDYVEGEVICAF